MFKKSNLTPKPISIFERLQDDILGKEDLSVILRKAKVLAYKLENQEFKDWLENELNGYGNEKLLPQYRKLDVVAFASYGNSHWRINKQMVPLTLIPEVHRSYFTEYNITQGVIELESLVESLKISGDNELNISIPFECRAYLSRKVYHNLDCTNLWRTVPKSQIIQVIETTRNSLLNFILELGDKYPAIKSDKDLINPIPDEQIRKVFNYFILGGKPNIINSAQTVNQGDNMAIFDQRNQKVNTQYNAARNINFNGINNKSEFIEELKKLKAEVLRLAENKIIDGEIVTDAEYQLTKAIQQSEKIEPNSNSISQHLNEAKKYLSGIETATAVVTAITEAIKVAQTIFG
ncbi:MAG: hypothetical protein LUM44_09710 [Pyrinomonadaceae bacterium]|nr:hypothetical protein [Pyrinomonadaceae bacterium]